MRAGVRRDTWPTILSTTLAEFTELDFLGSSLVLPVAFLQVLWLLPQWSGGITTGEIHLFTFATFLINSELKYISVWRVQ